MQKRLTVKILHEILHPDSLLSWVSRKKELRIYGQSQSGLVHISVVQIHTKVVV